MKKIIVSWLILALLISLSLNLFQWRNQAVTCENINTSRKAELLYTLGHKHLDWNKNWIPCENLVNQK